MKLSLPILGLAWLTLFSASAQVTVDVVLDQDQFLPGESLPVAVRITNRSGQPLHLGADANWLTFSVETVRGTMVVRKADVPVEGEFDVGSSQVATKRVDLAPYFALTRQGGYRVTARVRIKDWNVEIPSPPQSFNVIDGAKLWSQTFGLPVPADMTNRTPEVRKYILEEANYLHSQLRMYVQVSDESEIHIFKIHAIGPMVSFSQPEAQVDRFSHLHVIYQSGAHIFTYSMVSPDGDIVRQEIYDYFDTRPRLHIDDDGNITVLGGARRVKPDDVPVVKPPNEVPAAPAKP
ncbi:MAG: hypothetical protein ACLP2Y_04260 [Limisphaerales bacterium]